MTEAAPMVYTFRPPPAGTIAGVTLFPQSRPLVAATTDVIPVGRSFLEHVFALRGPNSADDVKKVGKKVAKEEEFSVPTGITADTLDNYSLYDVLGLKTNTSAGLETIKKAYRKAVLLYHPDKQVVVTEDGHEDDQTIFLKIQLAFATLSDESKRRAYDSQLDFDESIPTVQEAKVTSAKGAAAFCNLFRPVFDRNARFAVSKPVPGFGDEDTPINDVHMFYSYWVKFDSWRDFSNVDMEHKPDEAGDRYEKRWMQKENAIVARKLKKKEMARINDLVMCALENDPRILADKLAQKKVKEDAKQAKLDEARRKEDEIAAAAASAEEAAAREKVTAKLAKDEKDKIKKLQSRIRSAFRKALRTIASDAGNTAKSEYGEFDFSHVESLCTGAEADQLLYLVEGLGADMTNLRIDSDVEPQSAISLEEGLQRVRDAINVQVEAERKAAEEEEAAKAAFRQEQKEKAAEIERKKKGLDREWKRDDLSQLSRCLAKFPAGTANRWETISNYLNSQIKPNVPFDKNEVMRAAQNAMQFIAQKQSAPSANTAAVANAVVQTNPDVAAVEAMQSPSAVSTIAAAASNSADANNISVKLAVTVTEWTQEEQNLLEDGLRKVPAGKTPEEKVQRWRTIAQGIPSKSAAECKARYAFLREQALAKKAGK